MFGKKRGNETVEHAAYDGMANSFGIVDEARQAGVAKMAIAVKPRDSR